MPISQRQDQGGAHRRSFRPPHQARGIDQQARQEPRRRKSDYTALWTHRFFPAAKKNFLSFFASVCVLLTACLSCAELYMQYLARALSHHFQARLLILDVTDFSLRVRKGLFRSFLFSACHACCILNSFVVAACFSRSKTNMGAPPKPW
jgi:hypothetical protein